jgi:drug/metabolite transporter (DMT)-like permease
VLVLLGVSLSALGSIFLKAGAVRLIHENGIYSAVLQGLLEWRLYAGVVMYVIPVLIWIYLLKKLDITYLQPLFSLVYVVTPIVAIFYLGESVPIHRWAGIAIILVGIAISSRG